MTEEVIGGFLLGLIIGGIVGIAIGLRFCLVLLDNFLNDIEIEAWNRRAE